MKYAIRQRAGAGITDKDTLRAYRRAAEAFDSWAREYGCRRLENVSAAVIQAYEAYLEERPEQYTAATIHAKIAPICKAVGVSMREIRKPKRTASRIVRGRREGNKQTRGDREADQERYGRLVTLQKAVGIRRAELAALRGSDLLDEGGQLYVRVRRGKGGKAQMQYVLPADREAVRAVFAGIEPDAPVFSAEEMQNHINLHGLRAAHARRCYDFYARATEGRPEAAERLREALLRRWSTAHPDASERTREAFLRSMDDRPYVLRGDNAAKARAAGRPTEYNRLALMAVSVYHLSHWRTDVTVTNYML